VFIEEPRRPVRTSHDALHRWFDLSPAEAAVATGLMRGRSIAELAAELAISRHTVRTHVKHILSKTRTSRQGELISVLLRGPAALAGAT